MNHRIDKLMELPDGERGVRIEIAIGPERVTMEGDCLLVVVLQEGEEGVRAGTHVNGGYFGPPEGIALAAGHALALAHDKGMIAQSLYYFGISQSTGKEGDDDGE